MLVNINQKARVKLTASGHRTYEKHLDSHPLGRKCSIDERDADGYLVMQIWQLMRVFAYSLVAESDVPFHDNIMVLSSVVAPLKRVDPLPQSLDLSNERRRLKA